MPAMRRDLPVAEVAGEDQDALALRVRRDEGLDVLDAHQRQLARRRQPAEAEELAGEPPQVGVVRLREPLDLRFRRPCRRTRAGGSPARRRGAAAGSDRGTGPPAEPRSAPARRAPRPRRSRGRGSATARSTGCGGGRARPARSRSARPAARRSCRARPRNRRARSAPSAASRGNSFTQASFAAKRAARLARAAGAVAAVGELLRGKERARDRRRASREQPLDARDLDGVDAAAIGPGAGVRHAAVRRQAARTTSAALVPAKPRQRISATSLRGACGVGRNGEAGALGIEPGQRRDAGHLAAPRARRAPARRR